MTTFYALVCTPAVLESTRLQFLQVACKSVLQQPICATMTIVLRAPPLGGLLQLFGHMTAHVGRRNVVLGDQGHAAAIVLGVVLFLILPQVPAAALVLGTLRACKLPDLICLMTFPCQM